LDDERPAKVDREDQRAPTSATSSILNLTPFNLHWGSAGEHAALLLNSVG